MALGSSFCSALRGEQHVRRGAELDPHFARALRQAFAGAQIKRHAGPAPVVNEQFQCDVGFHVGIRFHFRFLPVARHRLAVHRAGEILAAHDLFRHVFGTQRADGFEQFHLFVADGFGFERHGRFHRHERKDLEHVVLHHVAQRAGFLVITAALAHAEFFADGDLHVVNQVAVPEPLENGIGKAEHQNVLHRFLAEVMVNAADLLLVGEAGQFPVQRAGGGEVMAERFLDDDALPGGTVLVQQPGAMDLLDDFAELAGRNGQVKQQVFPQRRRCRTRSAVPPAFCRPPRR